MFERKLAFILIVVGLILPSMSWAQVETDPTLYGDWSGAIVIQSTQLTIHTHFSASGSTIDIPQQGAIGLRLQNVELTTESVHFELPAGPGLAVFHGVSRGDSIDGSFEQAGIPGSFYLTRSSELQNSGTETEPEEKGELVSIAVADGELHGTLLIPDGQETYPLVILIAGSGPTDRDGNTVGNPARNNSLRMLAEALQAERIATLRFDKRGVGSSQVQIAEADLRVDSFAVDVQRWREFVASDSRFSTVFFAGHSEGSLLASIAGQAVDVDGIISIAGAGRLAPVVLREQLAVQLPPAMLVTVDSVLASLSRGQVTTDFPQELTTLFRMSVQPYLISWFARDPAEVFSAVKKPKLILQGSTDIQVTVADAERLLQFSPDARLKVIQGMNHILKNVSSDRGEQLASYSDPSLPINTELVAEIVRFVNDVTSAKR